MMVAAKIITVESRGGNYVLYGRGRNGWMAGAGMAG
jgi:hypothetical protein